MLKAKAAAREKGKQMNLNTTYYNWLPSMEGKGSKAMHGLLSGREAYLDE